MSDNWTRSSYTAYVISSIFLIVDVIAQLVFLWTKKKIPFIIKRPIPGGAFEYWKLKDLEIIHY